MVQYKFYATLLDKFESYINSSRIYQQYYGFAENPSISDEEFEQKQFQGLIDTINRVPFDSELADKGTAFNEVVDCIIENRKSDIMEIKSVKDKNQIWVNYKERLFKFPIDLCREFATYFKDALTQQRVEGVIPTKYGDVLLYGYIDELMPFKVADIKTTKKYNAFKYRHNWQHHVYLFCLNQNGILIDEFEYTVTNFKQIFTEVYTRDAEKDTQRLINHCEKLIEFIEQNKALITDVKIFATDELEVV